MKKLKIGIITHNFPTSESERQNAGIFVYDLAKALSKKSEVLVFSPGPIDGPKKIGNIKTHFFKFEEKLGNLKIYNPTDIVNFARFFLKGRVAFNKFLNENPEIDFIISMWAFPSGYFAFESFKKRKIPYAIYCLGSDIYIYAKNPFLKSFIKTYLLASKFNLADSPDLASETKKLSGKETIFLPSASNFNIPGKPEKKKSAKVTFTFLGRLEKVKGVDLIIKSLKLLGKKHFTLNIIGNGSLFGWIKQQIKNNPNVNLFGNINDPRRISTILHASNWLIIPSRSDSIPLVFSESMKHSLPVIVSSLPDLKYLVDKYKVGLIFKKGDFSSLSKILQKVLDNKTVQNKFVQNTKKAATIFDLEKTSDKLINLITKK